MSNTNHSSPTAKPPGKLPTYTGTGLDQILRHSDVASVIKENPETEQKIKQIAELVKNEMNAVGAVIKAANAINTDKLNVFFSYKMNEKDEHTAQTIVSELRNYAGGRLNITYAGEFKEKNVGGFWNKEIRSKISDAHWFILLLPDPSVDWDWCLFETGMFRGRMCSDEVERLICLYHPDIKTSELPDQIKEFQPVKGDKESVIGFLNSVYHQSPIMGMDPINEDLSDGKIEEIADHICSAINPPLKSIKRDYFDDFVLLEIENPAQLKTPEDLKSAKIIEANETGLTSIFKKKKKPDNWGKLIENIESQETRWIVDLCTAIRESFCNNVFETIQAGFQAAEGSKMYRPLLHSLDKTRISSKHTLCHIIFTETVGAFTRPETPKDIAALATALRMAYRFRWEVIERFMNVKMTEGEIKNLQDSMRRIESNAESRGLMDPDALLSAFAAEPDRKQIELMYSDWFKIRNEKKTGELDTAMEQNDFDKIKQNLNKMAKMNKEFLDLTLTRMHDLMT